MMGFVSQRTLRSYQSVTRVILPEGREDIMFLTTVLVLNVVILYV